MLRATRTADLANDIRVPRLLIEARALSDLGRHDFALEVIAGIEGRESIRLRADIYWAARNWQKAAEHIELLYGDRWKSFEPLTDPERIGHPARRRRLCAGRGQARHRAAAREIRGQDGRRPGPPRLRHREAPIGTSAAEFQDVAKKVAKFDTLDAFLRDMRARYPDAGVTPPAAAAAKDVTPPAPPPVKPNGPASQAAPPDKAALNAPAKPAVAASPLPPKAPAGVPLKPDQSPTGSVGPRLPTIRSNVR